MPIWRCPACSTIIQHAPNETMPRVGAIYRCSVCRLELAVDAATQRMTIAPMDPPTEKPRRLDQK